MGRLVWISIIIILLIAIVFAGYFLYINMFSNSKSIVQNTNTNQKPINKTIVGVDQINFILYDIHAYDLHNPPLSSDTPKIEMIIGEESYSSEVIEGKVQTIKGKSSNPDLRITMPEEELINALNSNTKEYLQKSVSDGKTQIEVLAGKLTLFSKGYLNLYKEITGETLSGSIIKSFK